MSDPADLALEALREMGYQNGQELTPGMTAVLDLVDMANNRKISENRLAVIQSWNPSYTPREQRLIFAAARVLARHGNTAEVPRGFWAALEMECDAKDLGMTRQAMTKWLNVSPKRWEDVRRWAAIPE